MQTENTSLRGNGVSDRARRWLGSALVLTAGLGLAACDDSETGPEDAARVQIMVTDAPSDYIESAEVWISKVYLQGAPDTGDDAPDPAPGRLVLFEDAANPFHVDLLVLRDGLVAELTEPVAVDPGGYNQLRIVIDSAYVTLKEGVTFADGTSTQVLKIPSGSNSGVKVFLDGPIAAEAGEQTTLLLDFDVDDNFKIQGNPDSPAGIKSIMFTPVIKELNREEEPVDEGVGG